MKPFTTTFTLVLGLSLAQAQERLSQEEALQYAKAVGANVPQLNGTPIPTSVDLTKPVAMRDGEFGGMVLPQSKLTEDALAKPGDKIVAVGQLWLLKLAPVQDGTPVDAAKLRIATVKTEEGDEVKAPQCALGVGQNPKGELELLIFGKDKEPVLKTPLKKIEGKEGLPLELNAERTSEAAKVTLRILGKYEASFNVTALDE